jgi:RNA polymerase sigma-70 factor (ECF subfamily)
MEGRPSEDQLLVRRAQEGDRDAFAALLRAHQVDARGLARLLCGDDGDDATQEAFVKSWSALRSYRGDAPFRSWLLRIVANEARNRRRAAGRRRVYELRTAEDRATGEAAPSPEVAVLAHERATTLINAVDALPDAMREVVMCRHLMGLSEAEAADVLAIPAGTVKSRLSRALDQLRAALSETVDARGHDG